MTIERWSLVSDGKRYHGIQRDHRGEYVTHEDYLRDIGNLSAIIVNRLMDFGCDAPPLDTPFNHLVDTLIKAVEQRTAERANKRAMFSPEVIKAAEELTQRFPHSIDAEEQVFRTAQVIQEVVDGKNALGAGIGMDGKAICK